MSRDFTLDKYAELCRSIQEASCEVVTISEFLHAGQPREPLFMLRHDIDRRLSSAIRMATMEAHFEIRSTYYVRMTPSVYQPDRLVHLHRLGHEIGYHYEVLPKSRGDHERALVMFEQELSQLRRVAPVETASAHGSPLSSHDSRDLWRQEDIRRFDLLGEVYLDVDYEETFYFTDTGRSWDADRYNIRDRVGLRPSTTRIHKTDDLLAFVRSNPRQPILINTHPNRWAENRWRWLISATSDWAANRAKRSLLVRRGLPSRG